MKMRSGGVLLFLALASVSSSVLTDQPVDHSGRWFLHASSGESCVVAGALPFLQWASMAMDLTSGDRPDTYNVAATMKMSGFCGTKTKTVFIKGNSPLINTDQDVAAVDVLPQTYCSDCVTMVTVRPVRSINLFSRRQALTMSELRNFQIQASGLNLTSLLLWDQDYDATNCKDSDEEPNKTELKTLQEKMVKFRTGPKSCS